MTHPDEVVHLVMKRRVQHPDEVPLHPLVITKRALEPEVDVPLERHRLKAKARARERERERERARER